MVGHVAVVVGEGGQDAAGLHFIGEYLWWAMLLLWWGGGVK